MVETDQAEGQSVLDGGQARLLAAAALSGNTCVLLISPKTNLRNTFHTSRVNVHPPQLLFDQVFSSGDGVTTFALSQMPGHVMSLEILQILLCLLCCFISN